MTKNIGIDLGTHSIKVVELYLDKKNAILNNFAIYDSDKLILDFNNPEQISFYSKKIKDLFSEIDFSSKYVNLALPESDIFLSIRQLPKMKPYEIKNYINLQSGDLFPENVKDLTYDYKIINDNLDGMLEILFAGARKSKVDSFIKLLHQSGLQPKLFEAKAQSLSRIIDDSNDEKANIILDLGYSYSTIHISKKRTPRFTKTISIGSASLNRALIQNLSLSRIQAENYKRSYGLIENVAEGRVYNYLFPLIDSIVLDVKRSIIYYMDKNKETTIGKIYLVGGMSKLPNLANYLEKKLSFEVEIFDPFNKIKIGSDLKKYENELKDISSSIVGVLGLAGAEIL
jgi:type IV pilus assembly protein PilM